ncbi:YTH domain-containing protein 1-like isoform X2 [Tubulanus polymorphus]|uniref:YTH domain-containing protein 1-like isoform X2 n=1 Tax=Tubulanus polymorphus TaxID=672921 RepID=UPI003DA2E280
MSEEIEAKEGIVNVLDDILHEVDDDLNLTADITPMEEEKKGKPKAKVTKTSKPVKKASPKKPLKTSPKKVTDDSPNKGEEDEEKTEDVTQTSDDIKELEKKRKQLAKENAERKKKLEKLKEEEKALASQEMDETEEHFVTTEENEENLNFSYSGDEGKGLDADNDTFDTRSEAGSSSGSTGSSSDSESGSDHSGPSKGRVSSSVNKKDHTARYIKYLFRDARFFIIKSNNQENISLSKAKNVWSTPPQNEAKLNHAFRMHRNVILIYSVKESGKFAGFARLAAESDKDHPPIRWVLPPGMSARALSGVFRLQWINRRDLPFSKTMHLQNPWNENKPVKIGRDGQEIEPHVAERLCRLFAPDDNIDLATIVRKARSTRRPSMRDYHSSPRRYAPSRDIPGSRRRRHPSDDGYYGGGPRYGPKRGRGGSGYGGNMRDPGYYKDRRDRSPRFQGVRRDTFVNGWRPHDQRSAMETELRERGSSLRGYRYKIHSYSDYMREYQSRAPMPPMAGYPPLGIPYGMDPYTAAHYTQRRDYLPPPEYMSSRSRRDEKRSARSYERDVEDFLRRTSNRDRRHRDRR